MKLRDIKCRSYAEAKELLAGKDQIKIGHNTWLGHYKFIEKDDKWDFIDVRFHDTMVVRYYNDGAIRINSGGYRTVTTKQRINLFIPREYRITQENFEWFIYYQGKKYDFFDGAIL